MEKGRNQAHARDQNLDPIRLVVSLLSGSSSTSSGRSSGSCTSEDAPTCRLELRLASCSWLYSRSEVLIRPKIRGAPRNFSFLRAKRGRSERAVALGGRKRESSPRFAPLSL